MTGWCYAPAVVSSGSNVCTSICDYHCTIKYSNNAVNKTTVLTTSNWLSLEPHYLSDLLSFMTKRFFENLNLQKFLAVRYIAHLSAQAGPTMLLS